MCGATCWEPRPPGSRGCGLREGVITTSENEGLDAGGGISQDPGPSPLSIATPSAAARALLIPHMGSTGQVSSYSCVQGAEVGPPHRAPLSLGVGTLIQASLTPRA